MRMVDLEDDELAAVIAALRRVIGDDRYPLSPRLGPLKSALAKLDPRLPAEPTRAPLPAGPKVVRPPRTSRRTR